MHEGGGGPQSRSRINHQRQRHVTLPSPKIAVSNSAATEHPGRAATPLRSALSAVVGRQSTTERRECHSAPYTATIGPPLLRPRPDRQGRSRQGWLIWAEKGLEMRPVGAPHSVALRHFLRNKGLAAGLVPMMADCSA